jgi:hypothetical protein
MRKRKKMEYQKLKSGEPYEVGENNILYMSCCDCGLVHEMKIKHEPNKFIITFVRDEEKTSEIRKNLNVKK